MYLTDFLKKNRWNFLAVILSVIILVSTAWIINSLGGSIDYSDPKAIKSYSSAVVLELKFLPYYTWYTVLRMTISIMFSLMISLFVGVFMARYEKAAHILLPLIDILQSIPVLGFLTITTSGFLSLFPNSLWGAQLAVIFALITAQIWNMILCVYQSLKNIPHELKEMTRIYRLPPWQVFWQLEIPSVARGLIWNTMMSMSASWFMIAASETIVINMAQGFSIDMNMPGIGAVIREANLSQNYPFILMALMMMLFVIIMYDNLIFKPLLAYLDSFTATIYSEPYILKLLKNSKIIKFVKQLIFKGSIFRLAVSILYRATRLIYNLYVNLLHFIRSIPRFLKLMLGMVFLACVGYSLIQSLAIIDITKFPEVFKLSLITSFRVFCVILLASLICVPIAIYIGRRARLVSIIQPLIQILASIPINILHGLFAYLVIKYKVNFEVFCVIIMFLGAQWYTLFNVISGVSMIPEELEDFVKQIKLRGAPLWGKFLLPAILPSYITGIIATSGAAWNMSVVCEYLKWGNDQLLQAEGIGSYLSRYYGQQQEITMGVIALCVIIGLINRLFWQKILAYVDSRYRAFG